MSDKNIPEVNVTARDPCVPSANYPPLCIVEGDKKPLGVIQTFVYNSIVDLIPLFLTTFSGV